MKDLNIKKNVPLKDLTTFKVGGEAKYFVEVSGKDELIEAVKFAKEKGVPIFILGGGSDILMSDEGFNGLVIRYTNSSISFKEKKNHVLVKAGSGMIWDDLVEVTVEKNLQGIECLSGIPGTVGAAPIQNIGAYGQELKDVFVRLNAYELKKDKFVIFDKEECQFAYRDSIFKDTEYKGKYLITDITLKLEKNSKPTIKYQSLIDYLKENDINNPSLKDVREAVLTLRGQKLEDPKYLGNAGSFFKNPIVSKQKVKNLLKDYPYMPSYELDDGKVKLFAGWLIDKAEWKGKRYKNAKVSEKNALVLVNPKGEATAKEIMELAEKISEDVHKKFGIKLEPEVQLIGFD